MTATPAATALSALLHRAPLDGLDRRLIELTRLEGHTVESAAGVLGISVSAATSRRDRAERRLRDHLTAEPQADEQAD